MKRQKDEDARWTKKHGKRCCGHNNSINIDKEHTLIRRYALTDASVRDGQVFDEVLVDENGGRAIRADSAYRSAAREAQLRERGYKSRICRKGTSSRHLDQQGQATHHRRSKVRARVAHVCGDQRKRGIRVRTKGKVRMAVKIGLMNLTYNMRRLEFLPRPQSACCTG